jgi:CRISPR-associated protein Csd1
VLLQRLKEYAQTQPEAAPFHRERRFSWQIDLDLDGRPRSTTLAPLVEVDAKGKSRGVAHRVPAVVRTVAVAANLAADDVQYVLGWPDLTSKPDRVAQCHAAFVELVERWAASPTAADDPVPAAVAAFYRNGAAASIVRPDVYSAKDGVVIVVGSAPAHQAPSATAFWSEEVARRKCSTRQGRCLVCGERRPLLDTVPGKIPQRLVPGATNDAALVSINAAAFGYDLTTQLASTPMCLGCGEAVTAGLHGLLESPTNSTTASGQDSKLAWWVIGGSDSTVRLLNKPRPTQIVDLLQSLHKPRKPTPPRSGERSLAARFHSVTVGGNVARVVVRDWVEMPLADVEKNIGRWFADHEMASLWNGDRYYSVGRFALATGRWQGTSGGYAAFGGRGDGRPKEIYRDLMRAALRGGPLPPAVLAHVITRIRADRHVDDARTSLIRLALTRSRTTTQEKPMPDLDPTSTDPAYVAGCLFAAYEQLQYDAHNPPNSEGRRPASGKLNVTFADRYIAGAIVNPRIALLNGARDARAWLKKLRRGHGGLATNNEKRILELHQRLGSGEGYPARLTPDQQGRFVIGYHHQRAHQFAKRTGDNTQHDPGHPHDTTNNQEEKVV